MNSVVISNLGALGEGVGTLPDGMKVFVEGALPGETVHLELFLKKKTYAKGRLTQIVQRSAHRVEPICPLFGTCGGCHLMHLNYESQLEAKRQKVVEALKRLGKQTPVVDPCVPSSMPLHYRNKIQLPVQNKLIGLYRQNSHDVIDISHCYIHNEQGGKIYDWIRSHLPHRSAMRHLLLRTGIHTEQTLVILVTDGSACFEAFATRLSEHFPDVVGVVENINPHRTNTILSERFKTLAGVPYLTEKLLGKSFKIGPSSFFQVNTWQAEKLIQTAIELANLSPQDRVYDAYTGVGTFALFAAEKAKQVIGTEAVAEAISYAKENALLNGASNCTFRVAEASAMPADVTILNPPRKGCDPSVLHPLASKRVIYVSCDPATLSRDLALLPRYQIERVIPFDLFPQTVHVETLVQLIQRELSH